VIYYVEASQDRAGALFQPFSDVVWATLGAMSVIGAIVLVGITRHENRQTTWSDGVLVVLGAFNGQGGNPGFPNDEKHTVIDLVRYRSRR